MKHVVIYDACILYSAPLRDLFMRLALADLYQAKWTHDIHEEWMRSLLKNRPDLTRLQLERIREKMDMHIRDCLVDGYAKLIKQLVLPDSNDRHVLAAAIKAGAQKIITFNLVDFPSKALAKYNVVAQHPDQFLRLWLDAAPLAVINVVKETRLSLKNPPKTPAEYLDILLKQGLTKTVAYLQNHTDQI